MVRWMYLRDCCKKGKEATWGKKGKTKTITRGKEEIDKRGKQKRLKRKERKGKEKNQAERRGNG